MKTDEWSAFMYLHGLALWFSQRLCAGTATSFGVKLQLRSSVNSGMLRCDCVTDNRRVFAMTFFVVQAAI